jgi:hypothetical protein
MSIQILPKQSVREGKGVRHTVVVSDSHKQLVREDAAALLDRVYGRVNEAHGKSVVIKKRPHESKPGFFVFTFES